MGFSASDGAVLDAVRSARWPARKLAPGDAFGLHLSRMRGFGEEFTEYRAYRPGEDIRRTDWKLLARTDRAFVRLSNDRTHVRTLLIVDASGSFAYPQETHEKWHFARQLVIGLAAAALASGDPVGLLICRDRMEQSVYLRPHARQGALQRIASALANVVPDGAGKILLQRRLIDSCRRIVIVSDFLGDAAEVSSRCSHFAASGTEIYALHVVHAHELQPPSTLDVVVDPLNARIRRPMSATVRAQYVENFRAWRESLARTWRLDGAYFNELRTSVPVVQAIRNVIAR